MTASRPHRKFMEEAIQEAKDGRNEGGIPIGSVLVRDKQIVGRGYNRRIQDGSTVFHAEMDCLESAGRQTAENYRSSVLYSTLSPCSMCSGAVLLYGIPTVIIGENETFQGPEDYLRDQGVQIVNLDLEICKQMMKEFIDENPSLWDEDIGE